MVSFYLCVFCLLALRLSERGEMLPRQGHEQLHGRCNPLVLVMGAYGGDAFPGKVALHCLQRAVRQLPLHGEPGQQRDAQITSYGFTEQSVTYAFSIYGIATMAGSVVSGYLGSRFPMKKVLGGFYASRTLWIIGFLLLPKSPVTMYLFAILLGFTGAATVPPTSGLIGRRFGPAALGTLFGVSFLCHQVGSFVSAWIGGLTVTATGGYTLLWCIDAALCILAAACVFRIRLPAAE